MLVHVLPVEMPMQDDSVQAGPQELVRGRLVRSVMPQLMDRCGESDRRPEGPNEEAGNRDRATPQAIHRTIVEKRRERVKKFDLSSAPRRLRAAEAWPRSDARGILVRNAPLGEGLASRAEDD